MALNARGRCRAVALNARGRRRAGVLGARGRRRVGALCVRGRRRARVSQSPTVPVSSSSREACRTSPLCPRSRRAVSCGSLCLGHRHVRVLGG